MNLIELMLKNMGEALREKRRKMGQITLGELIELLGNISEDYTVVIDYNNKYPSDVSSYRGFYEDLAIEYSDKPITVGQLLNILNNAINNVFIGYKGGEYKMTKDTPVWISEYGFTEDRMVVGLRKENNKLVIVTKEYKYIL